MEEKRSILKAMKNIVKFFRNIFKITKIAIKEPLKYNIINTVVKGYPFDYTDLLELERVKLIEMRDYFFHSNLTEDDIQVSKEINLAIKLLDIMLENEIQLFHFEDPYPDEPRSNMFKPTDKKGIYELVHDEWERRNKYVCDVKVNTRNARRFVDESVVWYYEKYPADLYVEKARHLYHLIRERLEETWSN